MSDTPATIVNIDALLKLQQDYDQLRFEVQRTFEIVMSYARHGKCPNVLMLNDQHLLAICDAARQMNNTIIELRNKL